MKVGERCYMIRSGDRYYGKRNNQPFYSYDAAEDVAKRRFSAGAEVVAVELRVMGVMKPVPDAS